MKNQFIIIEGTDGSGKTTQLELLKNYLLSIGEKVETLDFPQYNEFWGKQIGRFLAGEFGELNKISPYLVQPLYMLDQASRAEDVKKWLSEGKYVLSNRYITSSMAHQSSRLPDGEKESFLEWINEAGYEKLGVHKEDRVFVLFVDPEISRNLLENKDSINRKTYTQGKKDIAEADIEHQKKSAEMYKFLCNKYPHWTFLDCIDRTNNSIKSKEEIHSMIIDSMFK